MAITGSVCQATTRSQSQSLDHKKTYNFTVDMVEDIEPTPSVSIPIVEEERKADCTCSNNRAEKSHTLIKQKPQQSDTPSVDALVLENVPDVLDINATLDNLEKEKPTSPKRQKSVAKPKDEVDANRKEQNQRAKVSKPDDKKKNSNRRDKRDTSKAKPDKAKKAAYKSKDYGKKQNKHKNRK